MGGTPRVGRGGSGGGSGLWRLSPTSPQFFFSRCPTDLAGLTGSCTSIPLTGIPDDGAWELTVVGTTAYVTSYRTQNTGYFTCDTTTGVCSPFNAWSGITLTNFNYGTTFDGQSFFTVDSSTGGVVWVCPPSNSPACSTVTMTVGGNAWPYVGITNLATVPR